MQILHILQQLFGSGFLAASIRLAVPLLLIALGCAVSERSGVMNIGVEGIMLIGAFFSSAVSVWTGNLWIGVVAGIVFGILTAVIFAIFCVTLKTNQIVTGLVFNILALGTTSLLLRVIFPGQSWDTKTPPFNPITIPVLKNIPALGDMLFNHQEPLTYIALLLVPVFWYLLFRTRFGLSLRAVGEYARAADTVGINVDKMRYIATLICGGMAGLSGAYLSLGVVHLFEDNMVLGRGFIGLAVAIFGKWHPIRILGAALVFGAIQSLEFSLQTTDLNISAQLPSMLPYILTILALVGLVGKITPPAEDGIPYIRE
jgi:simple sugar transport system permease protein